MKPNNKSFQASHESIQEELNEIGSTLSSIKKEETPFQVPEHYFSNVQEKVFDRICEEKQPDWTDKLQHQLNEVFAIIFKPAYALPVAAVLLTLVIAVPLLRENKLIEPVAESIENIEHDALLSYLAEDLDEYDIDGFETNDQDLLQFNETSLDDYIFENIDPQIFEEELL